MFDFYVWPLCLNITTMLHTRPPVTRTAGRWLLRHRWYKRWYRWTVLCLTLMFDHYVWTQLPCSQLNCSKRLRVNRWLSMWFSKYGIPCYMQSCMPNITINYMTYIALFLSISWRERLVHQSERVSFGVGIKELISILSCHPERAIISKYIADKWTIRKIITNLCHQRWYQ